MNALLIPPPPPPQDYVSVGVEELELGKLAPVSGTTLNASSRKNPENSVDATKIGLLVCLGI
jgi:hypothetical protein